MAQEMLCWYQHFSHFSMLLNTHGKVFSVLSFGLHLSKLNFSWGRTMRRLNVDSGVGKLALSSHSDGRTYGDLDPLFLERPLSVHDVVTADYVNSTMHLTRRGNFMRSPRLYLPTIASSSHPNWKKKRSISLLYSHNNIIGFRSDWSLSVSH